MPTKKPNPESPKFPRGHLPLEFVKTFLVYKDKDLRGTKTCIETGTKYVCVVVF
jgi:hypothetical protein